MSVEQKVKQIIVATINGKRVPPFKFRGKSLPNGNFIN